MPVRPAPLACTLAAGCVALNATSASATVLLFQTAPGSTQTFTAGSTNLFDDVEHGSDGVAAQFGDFVGAAPNGGLSTTVVGDKFHQSRVIPPWTNITYMHGTAGGATPNTSLTFEGPEYDPATAGQGPFTIGGAPDAKPRIGANYGDLAGVMQIDALDSWPGDGRGGNVIVFNSTNNVTLAGFDLATTATTGNGQLNLLKVVDGNTGVTLWDSGAAWNGSSYINRFNVASGEGTPTHTHVDLSTTLAGTVGSTKLQLHLGAYGGSAALGISNIEFSEVPEPASLALLGLGALAMLRRRG